MKKVIRTLYFLENRFGCHQRDAERLMEQYDAEQEYQTASTMQTRAQVWQQALQYIREEMAHWSQDK